MSRCTGPSLWVLLMQLCLRLVVFCLHQYCGHDLALSWKFWSYSRKSNFVWAQCSGRLALWSLCRLWYMARHGWARTAGFGSASNFILWIAHLFSQGRAGRGNYSSKTPVSCLVTEQPWSTVVLVYLYNLAQLHPRLLRNTVFEFSEVALILLGWDLHDYGSYFLIWSSQF